MPSVLQTSVFFNWIAAALLLRVSHQTMPGKTRSADAVRLRGALKSDQYIALPISK
ncbi:MAG: hypothetical protein ABIO19_12215 [Burkholderiaceae bacterium]